ncbi:MAG TPA: DUF1501 domain-containing protein [Tepidisphaeraceae bacterium]|nr:DUF1501 domain-containing protein [Tepidisphaeraceae bacterium]
MLFGQAYKDRLLKADQPTRREFAARTARALLGVGLLPSIFPDRAASGAAATPQPTTRPARGATAKRVIYLYMAGGMSHLDTFDPKPGTDAAGPVRPLNSSTDGAQLTEYLPRSAKCMHLGSMVRSMTSNQGAHEQGNYFMHTSNKLVGTIRHPAMGAWLDMLQGGGNATLPNNVYIGNDSRHPGAGFLPSQYAPLFVSNPENGLQNVKLPKGVNEREQSARLTLGGQLDAAFESSFDQKNVRAYSQMYDRALSLMKSADLAAFDLTQEPEPVRKAYGSDAFGQGCLLARRLVQRDVRFVEVSINGWDTHTANFVRVPELCDVLDRALSTLLTELSSLGMLHDTMVVLATEFGRTPIINLNQGRDHFPKAFSCAMFGGGIKRGYVHGKTNKDGSEVADDEVQIPDLNATIATALGLPLDKVILSPTGRPFTVSAKGKPVEALFA